MNPSRFAATTLFIFALFAAPLAAETTIELNPLKIEGLVVGVPQKIDADFATKHSVAVPKPFHFTIPTDRTKNIKVLPAPGGTGIFKISFATKDNLLRSNLQFIPFTLGEGTDEERLNGMARIVQQVFRNAVIDPDRAEINVTRPTEVGPYSAVESIGRYAEGDDTMVALRVVAVIEDGAGDGVIAIINALPKTTGMTKVGDIIYVDGSRALGTMRFD